MVWRIHHVAYVEKRKPPFGIELLYRTDQTKITFFDQIEQRQPPGSSNVWQF